MGIRRIARALSDALIAGWLSSSVFSFFGSRISSASICASVRWSPAAVKTLITEQKTYCQVVDSSSIHHGRRQSAAASKSGTSYRLQAATKESAGFKNCLLVSKARQCRRSSQFYRTRQLLLRQRHRKSSQEGHVSQGTPGIRIDWKHSANART